MIRKQRPFAILSLILLVAAVQAFGAPAPERAWAPVQDGFTPSAPSAPAYAPGRVVVQLTESAYRASAVGGSMALGEEAAGARTGLAGIDALALDAGVTAVRKAHGGFKDQALAEKLGAHRFFLFDFPADTDVPALAARLAADPDVTSAEPDWRLYPAYTPNDYTYPANWGHDNWGQFPSYDWGGSWDHTGTAVGLPNFDSDADLAWDWPQGFGSPSVVIAILDTGVDQAHADLLQVAGYDYGDGDSNPHDDATGAGHGTCCAGVAAAIADNGLVAAGVAGGCSIMPLKISDTAGSLYLSYATNAIYHAANNGAHIASMSFGAAGLTTYASMDAAVTYAHNQGVTLLAASGNDNSSTVDYPAILPEVIAVGAASPCGERKRSSSSSTEVNPGVNTDPNGYTCDGERWWGSNYGSTSQDAAGAIDVLAPTILPTTDITGSAGYQTGDMEPWFNGTSCATPYAAGVCALILSANPAFTPTQVRNQLITSATDVVSVESGAGWDRYAGYGLVNAWMAVGGGVLPPTADFSATPTSGCLPLTVQFTDLSTGSVTGWNWDFGDGGTDVVQHPQYIYNTPGTYTVTLTATGPTGTDSKIVTGMITVDPPSYSDFTASVTSGSAPLTVVFIDASANSPTSWHWDLGDGNISYAQVPIHGYSTPGLYTVTLTTSNACGGDSMTKTDYIQVLEQPPVADFTASDTTGCAPLSVDFSYNHTGGPVDTWAWDFGDGGTATAENPTHVYTAAGTYDVTLIVTGPDAADTLTVADMIDVSPAVVAAFSASDTTGAAPLSVTFTDQSTDATSWDWDFGDGDTSTAQNPVHEFASGVWTVTLIAANDCSADTASLAITATGAGPPVAAFSGDPLSGCAPLEVAFTDESTGTVTAWAWDFGDGDTSTLQDPTHIFNAAGFYDVRLIVSGAEGADTLLADDFVVTGVAPIADFSATPTSGADTLTVEFSDLSTGDPTSWSWTFGDGGTATTQNAIHTYTAAGRYTVGLTVGNVCDSDMTTAADLILVATTTAVIEVPRRFALEQNYPNPFNPMTKLDFSLEKSGRARLEVFDASGRSVDVLVDGDLPAGPHTITWQPTRGASGVYFAKLTADGRTAMRRMVLIR